jgi:hypothetical protein
MGIIVGIWSQWCTQAEIYVISYLLPDEGRPFDSSLAHTSSSICSGLVVLSDPGNMGITVGITVGMFFPSYIRVEVCVISYLFSVNDAIFDLRHTCRRWTVFPLVSP